MNRPLEVERVNVPLPEIILSDARLRLRLPNGQAQSTDEEEVKEEFAETGRYVRYAEAINADIVRTEDTLKGYFNAGGVSFNNCDPDLLPCPLSYTFSQLDEMVERMHNGNLPSEVPPSEIK